jgi:hypothetical protein
MVDSLIHNSVPLSCYSRWRPIGPPPMMATSNPTDLLTHADFSVAVWPMLECSIHPCPSPQSAFVYSILQQTSAGLVPAGKVQRGIVATHSQRALCRTRSTLKWAVWTVGMDHQIMVDSLITNSVPLSCCSRWRRRPARPNDTWLQRQRRIVVRSARPAAPGRGHNGNAQPTVAAVETVLGAGAPISRGIAAADADCMAADDPLLA